MKSLMKLLGDKSNLKLTLIFLSLSIILIIAAFIVGIADNPPGAVLLYAGTFALILTIAHRWREVKKFTILTVASIIGIPIFVVLHNLLEVLGEKSADITLFYYLLTGLSVISFMVALIVCPAGLIIGIIGIVVLTFRKRTTRAIED